MSKKILTYGDIIGRGGTINSTFNSLRCVNKNTLNTFSNVISADFVKKQDSSLLSLDECVIINKKVVNNLIVTPRYLNLTTNTGKFNAMYYTYEDGILTKSEDVTNSVNWSTSNSSIATVNNGIVTPINNGSCNITASYNNFNVNSGVVVDKSISVLPDNFTNMLSISTLNNAINIDETTSFNATYYTYNNDVLTKSEDVTNSVNWSTSNSSIATVNNGTVTGIAEGIVIITGKYNNYSDSALIKIKPDPTPDPEPDITYTYSLILNPSNITLNSGSSSNKITAKVVKTGSDNSTTDISININNITLTSSNSSVATVSNGIVTGVAEGNTTITGKYTYEGKTLTSNITVVINAVQEPDPEPPVQPEYTYSLIVSPNTIRVSTGSNSEQIIVKVKESNADETNTYDIDISKLTLKSNNTSIATVSNGVVTGVAEGNTTISVSYNYNGNNLTETINVYVSIGELPATKTYSLVVNPLNVILSKGNKLDDISERIVEYRPDGTKICDSSCAPDMYYSTYTSNNTSVVATSGNDIIGVSAGNAIVTVRYKYTYGEENQTLTEKKINVTVKDYRNVLSIKTGNFGIVSGQTKQISCEIQKLERGLIISTEQISNTNVKFTVENTEIGTITADGLFRAISDGHTSLIAEYNYNGETLFCRILINVVNSGYAYVPTLNRIDIFKADSIVTNYDSFNNEDNKYGQTLGLNPPGSVSSDFKILALYSDQYVQDITKYVIASNTLTGTFDNNTGTIIHSDMYGGDYMRFLYFIGSYGPILGDTNIEGDFKRCHTFVRTNSALTEIYTEPESVYNTFGAVEHIKVLAKFGEDIVDITEHATASTNVDGTQGFPYKWIKSYDKGVITYFSEDEYTGNVLTGSTPIFLSYTDGNTAKTTKISVGFRNNDNREETNAIYVNDKLIDYENDTITVKRGESFSVKAVKRTPIEGDLNTWEEEELNNVSWSCGDVSGTPNEDGNYPVVGTAILSKTSSNTFTGVKVSSTEDTRIYFTRNGHHYCFTRVKVVENPDIKQKVLFVPIPSTTVETTLGMARNCGGTVTVDETLNGATITSVSKTAYSPSDTLPFNGKITIESLDKDIADFNEGAGFTITTKKLGDARLQHLFIYTDSSGKEVVNTPSKQKIKVVPEIPQTITITEEAKNNINSISHYVGDQQQISFADISITYNNGTTRTLSDIFDDTEITSVCEPTLYIDYTGSELISGQANSANFDIDYTNKIIKVTHVKVGNGYYKLTYSEKNAKTNGNNSVNGTTKHTTITVTTTRIPYRTSLYVKNGETYIANNTTTINTTVGGTLNLIPYICKWDMRTDTDSSDDNFENATEKIDVSSSATWSSSSGSIATVSNGIITGVAAGTATITASAKDTGTTYTRTITVKVS